MITFIATLYDTVKNTTHIVFNNNDNCTEEDLSVLLFLWEEGNFSCDCNRRLFIIRQEEEREALDEEIPCGKTIKLLRLDWIEGNKSL